MKVGERNGSLLVAFTKDMHACKRVNSSDVNLGILVPTTPATQGPVCIPIRIFMYRDVSF